MWAMTGGQDDGGTQAAGDNRVRRTERAPFAVAVLLLLSAFAGADATMKSSYKTAYFWPVQGRPVDVWESTFTDYLNVEVGSKLNITFESIPARSAGAPPFEELLQKGEVDFIYAPAVLSECYQSLFQTMPLLTSLNWQGSAWNGGVIAVREDRDDLVSLGDVKGKVISSAHFVALTAFQMQAQQLRRSGVDVFADSKQVRMTAGRGSAEEVASGLSDVALTPAEWIAGYPLKVLHRLDLSTPEGPYPVPVSTDLIPNSPLSAVKGTDQRVITEVMEALKRMNSSHPAAQRAFYSGWVHAYSYGAVRNAMHESGLLRVVDGEWKCFDKPSMLYDFLTCPKGSVRKSKEEVEQGCSAANMSCPDTAVCVCSPCRPSREVEVVFRNERGDVQSRCKKMQPCGTVEQGELMQFSVVDRLARYDQIVEFQLWDRTIGGTAHTNQTVQMVVEPNAPYPTYRFNVTTAVRGTILLEILLGGEQVAVSPTLIEVTSKSCSGRGREADEEGMCVCKASTFKVFRNCIDRGTLIVSILVPCLLLIALGILAVLYVRMKASEWWRIDRNLIEIPEPVEILGYGGHGEVLKAIFLGAEVAIKRAKVNKMAKQVHGESPHHSELNIAYIWKNLRKLSTHGQDSGVYSRKASYGNDGAASSPRRSTSGVNEMAVTRASSSDSRYVEDNVEPVFRSNMEGAVSSFNGACPQEGQDHKAHNGNFAVNKPCNSTEEAFRCHSPDFRTFNIAPLASRGTSTNTKGGSTFERAERRSFFGRTMLSSKEQSFVEEIKLLANLRHPSITTMMGAVLDKQGALLVMELMKYGSLQDLYLSEAIPFDGDLVHPMLENIASGMDFLHSHDPAIVHCDLKGGNILVDEKFRAKVSDFGLSRSKQARGTPFWMAPELLLGEAPTKQSDVYSFGILLFEVMARQTPYEGEDVKAVLPAIVDPVDPKRPSYPAHTPPGIKELGQNLLLPQPLLRLSFSEIRSRLAKISPSSYKMTWSVNGKTEQRTNHTQAQAQEMVQAMFPPHIAEALVKGEVPPEDRSECATVFFSDIVGFTKLSADLDPHKVSDMLDRLFKKYDAIAAALGVYKLETIGDCYIGICNLVSEQSSDHVARIAQFSIEVLQASKETLVDESDPSKGYVEIRIGFDSGPVTGNVVGTLFKKYTIFGNTVNTASRMESTSKTGRIQCTSNSADLLRKQDRSFELVCRGRITIKGRGQLETFWLKIPRGSSQAATLETAPLENEVDGADQELSVHMDPIELSTHTEAIEWSSQSLSIEPRSV